jgi:hypothetical protein
MEDCSQDCVFTQFTRELLAKTGLSKAVYHLQHDSGFNINIILYVLWLAKASYGRISKRSIKILQAQIMLWHQRVIAELKYTHALVADHTDPLAVQIRHLLQKEIVKAHWIEQQMLYESQLKTQPLRRTALQQLADACASLMNYCELRNELVVDEDQSAFIQLFCVVFQGISRSVIEDHVVSAFNKLKAQQPAQMMWEEF